MDRKAALAALTSSAPRERLQAARALGRLAEPLDEIPIRTALRSEVVSWVKVALERALAVALSGEPLSEHKIEVPEAIAEVDADDVYAQAVEDTTDRLVHELAPILGAARYHASTELPVYATSATKNDLDRLASMLDAIETLGRVSRAPAVSEFNLTDVVHDAANVAIASDVGVEFAGPDPLLARGDPALILLVLQNAVRNASEALKSRPAGEAERPILITWDATDIDYWVAVLDWGCGLPSKPVHLFEVGATTKAGHLGMGLALVTRAAQSLRGRVELDGSAAGPTRFRFSWPKSDVK